MRALNSAASVWDLYDNTPAEEAVGTGRMVTVDEQRAMLARISHEIEGMIGEDGEPKPGTVLYEACVGDADEMATAQTLLAWVVELLGEAPSRSMP
ncbi:MAG: hypothetical protein AB7L84_14890 [Acidimicrobiia bacterium]